MNRRQVIGLLTLPLVLAGCGFHLRGPFVSPYQRVYLDMAPNTEFSVLLKRYLEASAKDLTLVNSPEEAQAIITLLGQDRQRQIALINDEGQVREYDLTLTIHYQVNTPKGEILHGPVSISTNHTINYSEKTFLSQANEEDLLYRDMTQTLVQQLVRQFRALKPVR